MVLLLLGMEWCTAFYISCILMYAAARPPAMRTLQSHLAAGAAAINSGPTFSLAYDNSSKPGRISQQTGKPMPPGAEFVSKAAGKNAKKRANKKAKAAVGAGDDEADEEEGCAAAGGATDVDAAAGVAQQVSLQASGAAHCVRVCVCVCLPIIVGDVHIRQ
jgi:hypothetical protein